MFLPSSAQAQAQLEAKLALIWKYPASAPGLVPEKLDSWYTNFVQPNSQQIPNMVDKKKFR